jgi:hypothetical protein
MLLSLSQGQFNIFFSDLLLLQISIPVQSVNLLIKKSLALLFGAIDEVLEALYLIKEEGVALGLELLEL